MLYFNNKKGCKKMKTLFKRMLPVLIGIALIAVISITLVVISVANNRRPVLSDGDEAYLEYGKLTVTKQELYDALKKDYGVSELNRLIDTYLFQEEMKTVNEKDLLAYIESDLFEEDSSEEKKQESWEDVLDSLRLTGILTKQDVESGKDYTDTSTTAWNKVKEYYRLQFAKREWAKKQYLEELKASKQDGVLFTEEEIKEYFENNYPTQITGIFIPFTSSDAAKEMLKKYGINIDQLNTSKNGSILPGWLSSSFTGDKTETPKPGQYLNPNEIVETFIAMYNEVLSYYVNGDKIITEEDYSKTYSETKTIEMAKNELDYAVNKYTSIKGNLNLPLAITINGFESKATIEWTAVDDENFKLDAETGALTVVRGAEKIEKTIEGKITLGEATKNVSYKITVVATTKDDTAQDATIDVTLENVDQIYDYTFNFNNEMGNEHSEFVWDKNTSSEIGKKIIALSLSEDYGDFYKSYSVTPWGGKNYTYLYIKLAESEAPELTDELKAEITEKMIDELYEENSGANLEKFYYEKRKENNLKIYDRFIEAIYEYNYNTLYGTTLKLKDYEAFKKNKKTNKTLVASINGKDITADELFAELEAKYGATFTKSFVDEYFILNTEFNTYYNPWKGIEDKKYIKALLKSDVQSFKQNFELDYFTYYYLAYYGFIPNFPASYGWKNFIHDYFGADSEKELLINKNFGGSIYSDVLTDYTKSLLDKAAIQKAMEEAFADRYNVDVFNIVISVDYNYDGTADTKIVETNKDDVDKENWTETQKALALELAELLMKEYDNVVVDVEEGKEATIAQKLEKIVDLYNKAAYEIKDTTTVDEPTEDDEPTDFNAVLSSQFGKYKLAGLLLKYEKSANYTQSSNLVAEFNEAMVKMWKYAVENNLVYDDVAAKDDKEYTNPIVQPLNYSVVENGTYGFATSYGYHAIAVEKASKATELPTADEVELYELAEKLAAAHTSIETAQKNMASAEGNEVAVTAYRSQINQLNAEIDELAPKVKALLEKLGLEGFKDEDKTYTIDETIKSKYETWYSNAKKEAETYLVEKVILKEVERAFAAKELVFHGNFNSAQFEFYLEYLNENYYETEE